MGVMKLDLLNEKKWGIVGYVYKIQFYIFFIFLPPTLSCHLNLFTFAPLSILMSHFLGPMHLLTVPFLYSPHHIFPSPTKSHQTSNLRLRVYGLYNDHHLHCMVIVDKSNVADNALKPFAANIC